MTTVPGIADLFALYDKAVRQVIELTVLDAAYGVMMMGEAEQSFAQLRGALAGTSRQAEQQRDIAATGLATGLAHMRLTFLALVLAGAAVLGRRRTADRAGDFASDHPADTHDGRTRRRFGRRRDP